MVSSRCLILIFYSVVTSSFLGCPKQRALFAQKIKVSISWILIFFITITVLVPEIPIHSHIEDPHVAWKYLF